MKLSWTGNPVVPTGREVADFGVRAASALNFHELPLFSRYAPRWFRRHQGYRKIDFGLRMHLATTRRISWIAEWHVG